MIEGPPKRKEDEELKKLKAGIGTGAECLKSMLEKDTIDNVLEKRKIERDSEGNLILYHATTADKLAKILSDGKLRPPKDTGERNWRLPGEEDGDKMSKIYIGSQECVKKDPAKRIVADKGVGGRAFIIEVHVDEQNLAADEDFGDTWIESLETGGLCAYQGDIENFKIFSIGDIEVPHSFANKLSSKSLDRPELRDMYLQQLEERKREILEKENNMFKEAGINLEDYITS